MGQTYDPSDDREIDAKPVKRIEYFTLKKHKLARDFSQVNGGINLKIVIG